MLYEKYFERLEKNRWMLTRDIPFDQVQKDLVTPEILQEVKHVCLTELSALYASEMFIRDFYHDIDFCQFVSIWYYEEMKHHLTLRKYLAIFGIEFTEEEMAKLRLSFEPGPWIETLTMHYIGEQRLGMWYSSFAAAFKEPVLRKIFETLSADEYRHAACYAGYLKKAVAQVPGRLENIMKMAIYMLRTHRDETPKHPTTLTEPSVVSMLEDPYYIVEMLRKYVGPTGEEQMRGRVLAHLSSLAGENLTTVKDLVVYLRNNFSKQIGNEPAA